jgi:hypothetical protein
MTPKESSAKVCPIMSFHHPGAKIHCLRDECEAWMPACKSGDEDNYCAARDSGDRSVSCQRGEICHGYCKLIEGKRRDTTAISQ